MEPREDRSGVIRRFWLPATTSLVIVAAVMMCGFMNFVGEIFTVNLIDRDLATIGETALELKERTGKYPATLEELTEQARAQGLERFMVRQWEDTPTDYTGSPYLYEVREGEVKVRMPGMPGSSVEFEWPFPRGYWLHKLHEFVESSWFWHSLLIAVLSGIPPVLLWRLREWRRSKTGGKASAPLGLIKALVIAGIASVAGMVILFLHYGLGHH